MICVFLLCLSLVHTQLSVAEPVPTLVALADDAANTTQDSTNQMGDRLGRLGDKLSKPSLKSTDMSDAQIFGNLMALGQSEVNLAHLASEKSRNDLVRTFAAKLEKTHKESDEKTKELFDKLDVSSQDSDLSRSIKANAASEHERLRALNGAAFDMAFLEDIITAHEDTLELVKDRLAPAARSVELVNHLKAMQTTLDTHLKEAQKLRDTLSKTNDEKQE